ncbi:chemotaxis protein CheW [candidate division KSB1 bacterium]|nr:chemotaxis protein CheW [candidate division KSB1 bacterium]
MNEKENSNSIHYLTFTLDGEVFALDISKVREVLDYAKITKIPRTPEFMRGVINLRGNVVPVIDVRLKFGLTETQRTVDTCIIIVEVQMDEDNIVLGALADSVKEVLEIEPSTVEPAPKMGTRLNTKFIDGMAKQDDSFIIILNIDKIFSTDELTLVNESSQLQPEEKETLESQDA